MQSDAPQPRRKPGALATEILAILSDSGEALTPGEVLAQLPHDRKLSYSTVVTTLTRLHDKEAVRRHRDGRAYRYAATGDPSTLVAWRMSRLLDTETDHASVLTRFVSDLSPADEQTLRELLADDD